MEFPRFFFHMRQSLKCALFDLFNIFSAVQHFDVEIFFDN